MQKDAGKVHNTRTSLPVQCTLYLSIWRYKISFHGICYFLSISWVPPGRLIMLCLLARWVQKRHNVCCSCKNNLLNKAEAWRTAAWDFLLRSKLASRLRKAGGRQSSAMARAKNLPISSAALGLSSSKSGIWRRGVSCYHNTLYNITSIITDYIMVHTHTSRLYPYIIYTLLTLKLRSILF